MARYGNSKTLGVTLGACVILGCGGGEESLVDASGGVTDSAVAVDAAGVDACAPTSCAGESKDCGIISDGCGADLMCGTCDAPDMCGGGGIDNVCGRACTRVGAIFFDLGDTLVQPAGGGVFEERPGAAMLITDLKALGMRVGIITNTPPGWTEQDLRNALVNPMFLDEFEVLLMSSQSLSPPKPDPLIFAEAHSLMVNAPPPIEEVAFITEDLSDIANQVDAPTLGARAAGMVGVHLSSAVPSPLADYTVAPDQLADIAMIAETDWLACGESAR